MSDELDSDSFNKNYRVLKETADWLSGQKEPDIDQLVPKVERAMRAYSICKDRLDKVQTTLGQYFQREDTPDGGGANGNDDGVASRPTTPKPSANGNGDGIPF